MYAYIYRWLRSHDFWGGESDHQDSGTCSNQRLWPPCNYRSEPRCKQGCEGLENPKVGQKKCQDFMMFISPKFKS